MFKFIFASVNNHPSENGQMLKPHLHTLVNKTMTLALTAEEPINYFQLLRLDKYFSWEFCADLAHLFLTVVFSLFLDYLKVWCVP